MGPMGLQHTSKGLPAQLAISEARMLTGAFTMPASSSQYIVTPKKPLSLAFDSKATCSTCTVHDCGRCMRCFEAQWVPAKSRRSSAQESLCKFSRLCRQGLG